MDFPLQEDSFVSRTKAASPVPVSSLTTRIGATVELVGMLKDTLLELSMEAAPEKYKIG